MNQHDRLGISSPLSSSARRGWLKFRITEALGPGEHQISVASPGPPVVLDISGNDYDERDRPTAAIQAYHPDIEGIGWDDIWEAVRRQSRRTSLVPAASDTEYESLKASIATFGAIQRVIVDETGSIIAGRLRKLACQELGVACPTEVIAVSPEQREQLAFELDFCRKQLTRSGKRQAAERLLKANPRNTDRAIGRACGLDHKTVSSVREELEERGEIPQVEQRQGADGKTYKFPRIAVSTNKEADRARVALGLLGDEAPKKQIDLRRAEKQVRAKKAADRRNAPVPILPDDSIQIRHSDFRDLLIEPATVPLIMTDPPYDKAALPLWVDLARFAKRVLRPDGVLATYAGTMFLPEVLAALTSELVYVWQIAVIHNGGQDKVWHRNIVNKYKPVLIFTKSEARSPKQINDVLQGNGKEKDFHAWQQNIEEAMHFIRAFSQPGDLVVDPFGGGFTTAAACHRLGRRCLTCDVDAEAVQRGSQRLADERDSHSS
jgi:site-specific DNA-methyltransferase (adenine-specific)